MPARSFALPHALKSMCLLLSTAAAASVTAMAASPARAETVGSTPAAASTTSSLVASASKVNPGTHPTLTVTVKHSDGSPANGSVQFFYRSNSSQSWGGGTGPARVGTSNGVAHFSYTAKSTMQFYAAFAASATEAASHSSAVTISVVQPLGVRAVQEAARHKGAPYQYGASGPTRFDCSGYTRYVFSRFGKSLPHNSAQQYSAVRHVSKSSMRVGDLLFFYNGGIHHVGIYAGNGYMWHAPHSGDVVRLAKIWTSAYYVGRVG